LFVVVVVAAISTLSNFPTSHPPQLFAYHPFASTS
jgi:hypothetical protein